MADALSRSNEPEPTSFHYLSAPKFLFLDELKRELQSDSDFQELNGRWQQKPDALPGFKLVDNLFIFQGRIWIPLSSRIKKLFLKEFHESPVGGHVGITKTFKRLAENFYWDHMRREVQEFIGQCVIC